MVYQSELYRLQKLKDSITVGNLVLNTFEIDSGPFDYDRLSSGPSDHAKVVPD